MTPGDAEHLADYRCPDCGHDAVDHYRNPGCRECACRMDPKCPWDGLLASRHRYGVTP